MKDLQTQIPDLSEALERLERIDEECRAANVEENDYTIFTLQDLTFELELVISSVSKKIAFIDNQVCLPEYRHFSGITELWTYSLASVLSILLDCVTEYDESNTSTT